MPDKSIVRAKAQRRIAQADYAELSRLELSRWLSRLTIWSELPLPGVCARNRTTLAHTLLWGHCFRFVGTLTRSALAIRIPPFENNKLSGARSTACSHLTTSNSATVNIPVAFQDGRPRRRCREQQTQNANLKVGKPLLHVPWRSMHHQRRRVAPVVAGHDRALDDDGVSRDRGRTAEYCGACR
jgi:hypothetical protein